MGVWRIGVLAALLMTGTACFQVDAGFEVGADGSLRVRRSMWLTPGSVSLLRSFLEEQGKKGGNFDETFGALLSAVIPSLDEAARAEAASAGVVVRESRSEVSASALGFAQDVTFPGQAALSSWWPRFEVGGAGLPVGVTCTADRLCTVNLRGEATPTTVSPEITAQLSELGSVVRGPAEGEKESKKAKKKREARMAELIPAVMGEMASMSVKLSVTVPGEVVSAQPADGVKIEGGTVTWTLDVSSAMGAAAAGGGAGSGPALPMPSGDAIVFRAAPGVVLPGLE